MASAKNGSAAREMMYAAGAMLTVVLERDGWFVAFRDSSLDVGFSHEWKAVGTDGGQFDSLGPTSAATTFGGPTRTTLT